MENMHHIALCVDDIQEASEWYLNTFKSKLMYLDDTWAAIQFDNILLALVLPGQHPPHIAVEREDAEKFGALVTHRDGTASTYIKDPWGNTIEILKSKGHD